MRDGGAFRALVRRLVRETVEETLPADVWAMMQDPAAQEQFAMVGWTIVTVDPAFLRRLLPRVKADGYHAATHNDGDVYALMISRRPIRSVAGTAQKFARAGEHQRPVTHRTLSIRF